MPEVLFIEIEMVYLHFSVCHVVSRPVAPSFSLANSLILADLLSAARERCKNTCIKVSFNTCSNQRCMGSAVSSGAVVFIGGGCVHRCSK